jgi:hypothetical protein
MHMMFGHNLARGRSMAVESPSIMSLFGSPRGFLRIHPGNAEGEMSGGFNSIAVHAVETRNCIGLTSTWR